MVVMRELRGMRFELNTSNKKCSLEITICGIATALVYSDNLVILSWFWWNFGAQPIKSTDFGHITSHNYATNDYGTKLIEFGHTTSHSYATNDSVSLETMP